MSPDRTVLRGTAQNPDAFFQARETINPFYAVCPDITQQVMEEFARVVQNYKDTFVKAMHEAATRTPEWSDTSGRRWQTA